MLRISDDSGTNETQEMDDDKSDASSDVAKTVPPELGSSRPVARYGVLILLEAMRQSWWKMELGVA